MYFRDLTLNVSFDFNCNSIDTSNQIVENQENQTNVTFSWAKATTIDVERYRTLTFELLGNINVLPAITYDDGKAEEHIYIIFISCIIQ